MLRSQEFHQGIATQGQPRKEHRCDEIDPSTGQRCNRPFRRAWNLKRHQRDLHQNRSIVFINYPPIAAQSHMTDSPTTGIQLPRIPALDLPFSIVSTQEPEAAHSPPQTTRVPWSQVQTRPSPASSSTSTIIPMSLALATSTPSLEVSAASATGHSSLKTFDSGPRMPTTPVQEISSPSTLSSVDRARSIQIPTTSATSSSPSQSVHHVALEHIYSAGEPEDQTSQSDPVEDGTPSSQTDGTSQSEQDLESDEAPSDTEECGSELGTPNEDPGYTNRKRKRSPVRGRVIDAGRKTAVPIYLVKRSKKTSGQQRGLDWLTAAGKARFDDTMERLLAQWGVKTDHRGTCVLLPEDWKALDPVELMAIFDDHQLPSGGASRAWYSYSDHATSLARAAAWSGHWPRTGVELDNFLGCGPFKPMDGSHLCHHEHCIIHLVYESAAINMDRWNCCLEARFLRQDNRDVSEHCTKHRPPCLMQHAALTSREAYYVQFAVLRQAKGIPSAPPIRRPRRYLYPTFESQHSSPYFPAITVDSKDLVQEAQSTKKEGRPDLICGFCPCIKTYASITAYWGHLVNKHRDINSEARLREVYRTATLWRTYWKEYSDGGKYGNPTMVKLLQIEEEGFGWQQVLDWGLR